MLNISSPDMSMKIIDLKLLLHLPDANELVILSAVRLLCMQMA